MGKKEEREYVKKGKLGLLHRWNHLLHMASLRNIIWIFFSISAISTTVFIFIFYYNRFSYYTNRSIEEENQALIKQVDQTLSISLREVMKLSDTIYYNVIKKSDIESELIQESIELLYQSRADYIENICILALDGSIEAVVPKRKVNLSIDVTSQDWFKKAIETTENMHFGIPRVQNVIENDNYSYGWSVSLSRAVQLTRQMVPEQGVLLIDLKYSMFDKILSGVSFGKEGYVYLIDSEGEIIYHPMLQLIYSGIYNEKNKTVASYKDGIYTEAIEGKTRNVIIKSVGYTGWKLVGVAPHYGLSLTTAKGKLFLLFIFLFFIVMIIYTNSIIARYITNPIIRLERVVKGMELGNLDTKVDIQGFREVEHLAGSIECMAIQIQKLMEDIVMDHESKRKNELDVLQSQINPHFLYNTLDIIVWMVENEQQSQAVRVVTALARFFRISLSNGNRFITVENEVEHVKNYLMIQEMRFKNKFTYVIEVEEQVKLFGTIKLILQPIVENAIYHGMEFMDGDGVVTVKVYQREAVIYLEVIDNGLGMTKEQVEMLLDQEKKIESNIEGTWRSKRGSGIGVRNVDERIRLYYGKEYGLSIHSEPDEGTKVTITIPAIHYNDMIEEL